MKRNLLLLSLLFFIAADTQAQEWDAQNLNCYENSSKKFYGKLFGGVNFLQNIAFNQNRSHFHTGYIVAGSFGYNGCYGLHIEGEYAYRKNAIRNIHFFGQGSSKDGHFQTSSYMANFLWDLPCISLCNIQSFIGAGIGYDIQNIHSSNSRIVFHQKWNHFAWQAIAGLTYPLFCHAQMTLEYKFHQGGSHFCNHSIGVGLIYTFDYSR